MHVTQFQNILGGQCPPNNNIGGAHAPPAPPVPTPLYYYKSLPSKSLTRTFMWRLPIPRDAPWRISILISIITMLLLLLFLLLLLLLFLLLLLVVVERINYSVIHMMAGMSTLTGPGIPMLTGPGAPVLTGSGTWMPTLAGPGMPTLVDSRMSVLTLTSQGVPTLLGSNIACSNYVFNFLFMVFIYIS